MKTITSQEAFGGYFVLNRAGMPLLHDANIALPEGIARDVVLGCGEGRIVQAVRVPHGSVAMFDGYYVSATGDATWSVILTPSPPPTEDADQHVLLGPRVRTSQAMPSRSFNFREPKPLVWWGGFVVSPYVLCTAKNAIKADAQLMIGVKPCF